MPKVRVFPFTVIIPAHNEAQVIGRCLDGILDSAPDQRSMQVIVAANGCSDATADIARSSDLAPEVLELPEGSKAKAMNAAKAIAQHPTCIFLDADVQCRYPSLLALAETLNEPGVMAASPALRMDLSRSSSLVKAYYRVWLKLPYITNRMVGSGCFGLSEKALLDLGDFPEIIGDDVLIRSKFCYEARRNVTIDKEGREVFFLVSPPLSLFDQIRVETRRRIGNEQVDAHIASENGSENYRGHHEWSDITRTRKSGASWVDIAIYIATKLIVVIRSKRAGLNNENPKWERDLAARSA